MRLVQCHNIPHELLLSCSIVAPLHFSTSGRRVQTGSSSALACVMLWNVVRVLAPACECCRLWEGACAVLDWKQAY